MIVTLPAIAQDDDLPQETDPKVRDKVNAARIAYLTDQLALTPDEAEKFWPIYNEFLEKRKTLRKEYRQKKLNPDPKKSREENDNEPDEGTSKTFHEATCILTSVGCIVEHVSVCCNE